MLNQRVSHNKNETLTKTKPFFSLQSFVHLTYIEYNIIYGIYIWYNHYIDINKNNNTSVLNIKGLKHLSEAKSFRAFMYGLQQIGS